MARTAFRMETAFGPVKEPAQALARSLDPGTAAEFVHEKSLELVFPDHAEDPLFREALYRSAYDNIDAMWRIIGGRAEFETSTPLGGYAFAEAAAEVGVPPSQFERVYQVGVGLVWICWYREALAHSEQHGVALPDLIDAPTMIIHAYLDTMLSPAFARFDETRAETRRTREHLRRTILRQALDGSAVLDEQEVADALGVPIGGEHLAFVVCAESLDHTHVVEPARLASGATTALGHRHDIDRWIVWLSCRGAFDAQHRQRLTEALAATGATIAVGDPTPGVDGLGIAGRDALEAARLQALLGESHRVLSFAEVRLEALLLGDPEQARRFVHSELRALDEDTPRAQRLRETAMLWLSTGSHVATGASLGLHEHTVRNRIALAEEMLGEPLVTRRTEILVALRLLRMLEGPTEESR